ncbi:hypothetical protein SK128_023599 [Halocaridina rubra]|uniref:GATA-type domain-containing protein n=1 Tax=Halocaridina rubra TaxID=373956 RepID=A0AAN8WCY4_HALRR
MQHNQVDRAEPLPECIEKYTLSSITLNHITNAICSVECYPDLQMCITNNDGKFHFYLDGLEPTFIHDPHSAQIMPTYHQIEDIVRDMDPDSYVKLQWENGYVNYYDYSGILRIKELILCKMIKDIMAEGRTFLSQSDIHAPVMLTNRINKENLQQFWTLLNEHKPNSILKLNDKVLSYNSLLSLMLPDSCLTEGILNHFSSMLNKDAKRNCTLVANYDEVKGNLTEFITQIKLTFGEDLLDVSIILYVNIDGHDVQSSVSESDLQSEPKHYVYAIYRVEANQVLYIDAFARPIPRLFRTFLIQLSKILGNGILYFGSYLEESSYVDQKKNICKSILPFTGCEAVGGISVVIERIHNCTLDCRIDKDGGNDIHVPPLDLDNEVRWLNDSKITVENEQYISHLHLGAASGKYSEDFDPELIIVLHDSPHEFSSPKDVNVSRNLKCKRVIPKTRNVSFLQSFPADNLEEPVSADVNMESLHTKDLYEPQGGYEVSSANTIKVGCSQGRIPVYFGEIKDLIIGRPIIAFRKKKCCYSFTCTFHTGDAAYKNFSCKKDKGRDDYNALKQINTFLKVKNFTLWMKENLKIKQKNKRRNASVDHPSKNVKRTSRRENLAQYLRQIGREDIILLENDTLPNQISDETAHICMEIGNNGTVSKSVTCREKNLQGIKMLSSSSINYDNIKECIVGKPKVHYIKAKNLYRLECLLWNGGKIHKHFACLPSERAKVLHDIQTFLNGDEAALWVKNYDDGWIFQYEVKAGADTRERLDKLTFDVTKHFIYNRKVVKPEYFKETCWVSVTENVKWGKTHRYDETYRLLKPSNTLDPNTIVAYVYLNCASKTNECRAACGPLLSSLTTCDGVCGNCGLSLASGRQCYNCKSTSSSQWYTKGEPGALCASCYTYRQRKGFHRHLEQKASTNKNVNKIHHSHLKCNWKMKLEMKLNNLNVWNVYEASENIRCHRTTPVQRHKKPALGTRDMWDKLRISRKSSSLQIHSSENKCKISDCFDEDNHPIHTLSQVKGRCELVDRHHSVKSSEGEPCCTALNVVEKEPMFQDTGKAVKAEMQLHFKETIGNHTRICGLCFEKGVSPPFTCISKRDLDAHKNKMHNSYGDLCGLCYKEHDVVVKFEDSRELSMHLNKHKSKCS